jgi:hypothetical protein
VSDVENLTAGAYSVGSEFAPFPVPEVAMRQTRFMSMLFLVWSIAFFFVPEFRQGLQVPFFALNPAGDSGWLRHAGTIPAKRLAEAAQGAEQQRDAQTLAFAALHAPTVQESVRLADEAVAIDPSLTWVFISLILPAAEAKPNPPDAQALAVRVEKWDPDNAFPYLYEAIAVQLRKHIKLAPVPDVFDRLVKETEWSQAMQKAFSAPHYDTYAARRFELERTWLRQNHLDTPAIVLLSTSRYQIPNLLAIRTYSGLLVDKYGKEAEDAKHLPEALGYYWTAKHFAERMRLNSTWLIEKLIAVAIQTIADKRLIPALRNAGEAEAATTLEIEKDQAGQWIATQRGKDPLAQSANYNWAALIVEIFAGLVAIFGALTLLCLLYVNAKRWARPESQGGVYPFLTVAENYMPVLLFLACAGLYLSYYPYAQNFHHYMTATGEFHDFEPLVYNIFPNYYGPPGHSTLPVGNPFLPYAWYALVGLILAALAAIPYHRRTN